MYERILEALADNHERGGIVSEILSGGESRAVHDALPLRLLGAIHLAVLRGLAPRLAAHYPSVGGTPGPDLCTDFLGTLADLAPFVATQMTRQVQTNEVGRSVVPLALMNWLAGQGLEELDWLEIGASAGLNLCFDSYCAQTSAGTMGDATSSVRFGPDWFDVPPVISATVPRIVRRTGTDMYPVDLTDDEQVLRITSFVWPDQIDRLERLRSAIEIAREQGHRVQCLSADDAIATLLDDVPDRATVVFHSIVWQYLGDAVQRGVREALERIGRGAAPARPLVWARMEPAGKVADVQVDIWDGTERRHLRLGTVGYHGRGLRWDGG